MTDRVVGGVNEGRLATCGQRWGGPTYRENLMQYRLVVCRKPTRGRCTGSGATMVPHMFWRMRLCSCSEATKSASVKNSDTWGGGGPEGRRRKVKNARHLVCNGNVSQLTLMHDADPNSLMHDAGPNSLMHDADPNSLMHDADPNSLMHDADPNSFALSSSRWYSPSFTGCIPRRYY